MERREKPLLLTLARRFAEEFAMPVLITDGRGTLVFFNEPAESILGQTFSDAGEMPFGEWGARFELSRLDGSPLSLEEFPGGVALLQRKPDHDSFRIKALDGVERVISVTALPLFTWPHQFVGAMGIFWEVPQPGTS